MSRRFIKDVKANIRSISAGAVEQMEMGLIPYAKIGDEVCFSIQYESEFVILEFKTISDSKVNVQQVFGNLPEFFNAYDCDIRFVLTEKVQNDTWEIGKLIE